jgi:hypothetical protein
VQDLSGQPRLPEDAVRREHCLSLADLARGRLRLDRLSRNGVGETFFPWASPIPREAKKSRRRNPDERNEVMSHHLSTELTNATGGTLGNRLLPRIGVLAATFLISACGENQYMAALVEPEKPIHAPLEPAKPMTPERTAWLKERCGQLVAYFDRYSGSRPFQNSDGRYNHTRIGAEIECDQGHYRKGIDTMAALMVRKNWPVLNPGKPPVAPEDQD